MRNTKELQMTISSREVAEMMEVNHKDLLKKIDNINETFESEKIRSQKYWTESSYKTEGNNKTYREFQITKKGCEFLAHKSTGEKGIIFTDRYMDRFEEMENKLIDISTKDKYISEIDIAKAELSLVEATAKLLNLNDSSKLALATNVYENHGIPQNLLPQYTKSKDRILPISDLLKKNYINMSAIAFNKLLVEKGILKECTRKTSSGRDKKFKMLVDTEWGENLVNPKCPKETQPMYYQDKFCELLKIVLNEDNQNK